MKVLLTPVGSRGDVQPQLLLGEELTRRGHGVTLAAPPDFREAAVSRGFRFIGLGESIAELLARHSGMTEQNPLSALPAQIGMLRKGTLSCVRDLFAAEVPNVDVVVSAGLSFGGQMLAEKRAIPHVFCCYTLSAMRSAEHAPPVTPFFGLSRFANRALWAGFTRLFQATVGGVLNDLRGEVGLPPLRRAWQKIHGTQTILAQDEIIGRLPADVPGRNLHVPAIVPHPNAARPLSDLLERFLRGAGDGPTGAAPVVYLGFGSMPSMDRSRIVQIARELFELHGARVILYSPTAQEAGLELPPGVFALGDTDHASLFPRVDLIVHHGGAGTTAAALRAGVPQLIVPHIVDQFFHGRRIADLGLGPAPIPVPKLSTDAIASALKDRFKYWAKAQITRSSLAPAGGASLAIDHLESLARP